MCTAHPLAQRKWISRVTLVCVFLSVCILVLPRLHHQLLHPLYLPWECVCVHIFPPQFVKVAIDTATPVWTMFLVSISVLVSAPFASTVWLRFCQVWLLLAPLSMMMWLIFGEFFFLLSVVTYLGQVK